jgi:hypothetical protein
MDHHHDGRIIKDLKHVTYFPVSREGNFAVVINIGHEVCIFTSYKYTHIMLYNLKILSNYSLIERSVC